MKRQPVSLDLMAPAQPPDLDILQYKNFLFLSQPAQIREQRKEKTINLRYRNFIHRLQLKIDNTQSHAYAHFI